MSKLTRREIVAAAGLAAPALIAPRSLRAASADYPNKPIRFIIPYAPGGGFDVYVRVIAPVMEQFLPRKVNIVPVNVAGGGGAKGLAQLYRAQPDGYPLGNLNLPRAFIPPQQQRDTAAN